MSASASRPSASVVNDSRSANSTDTWRISRPAIGAPGTSAADAAPLADAGGPTVGVWAPGASGVPQPPQNLWPGGAGVPQDAQVTANAEPQEPQNLLLAAFSAPQAEQFKRDLLC